MRKGQAVQAVKELTSEEIEKKIDDLITSSSLLEFTSLLERARQYCLERNKNNSSLFSRATDLFSEERNNSMLEKIVNEERQYFKMKFQQKEPIARILDIMFTEANDPTSFGYCFVELLLGTFKSGTSPIDPNTVNHIQQVKGILQAKLSKLPEKKNTLAETSLERKAETKAEEPEELVEQVKNGGTKPAILFYLRH